MADTRLIEQAVREANSEESFIQDLLIDALGWELGEDSTKIEDVGYEWSSDDLRADGLEEKIIDGKIYQIGPLEGNPWGIFLLNFNNPDAFIAGRGITGTLRRVLRGLVPSKRRSSDLASFNREHLLFIFTYNYEYYSFAYFKDPVDGNATAPLAAFGWGPDDHIRTICEYNLPALTWDMGDVSQDDWIEKWAEAFDVEKVTKRFYEDYKRVFESVERQISGLESEEDKRMFTQTLFNRLMFIRFIERKGWLDFNGQAGYLRSIFGAGGIDGESFYKSRLKVVFFEGFAVQHYENEEIIGNVPFLNGGLFEGTELDSIVDDIPDQAFSEIIGRDGLFYRYNFTIEESTPLDIEVAIDPEMLGMVFEKLVTGRKETGSFYTPKPVVSFMCKEALKGYLGGYDELVEHHSVDGISVNKARELLAFLRKIKVCDPACGSGAYFMGMLNEIHDVTSRLDTRIEERSAMDNYQRKLEIIQNNIYGVDLDEFAVNIARLRLWLSLVVDYDDEKTEPMPPLPNLDFKIEVGNSLITPVASQTSVSDKLVTTFQKAKTDFLHAHGSQEKNALRTIIEEFKEQIAQWTNPESLSGFDWAVEFAEVVKGGGFDVIIANPPYRQLQKNGGELANLYKKGGFQTFKRTGDIYCLFYERGCDLLRGGG
ncbi:MAG: hypothetical protein P9M15_04800, partial [Candidatus Electryoneaceae bacterium]|nr:hypothetical protein [Candidatus Electryoneaceae bacterium]